MSSGIPFHLLGVFGNPSAGLLEVAGFESQGERECFAIVFLLIGQAKDLGRKAELRGVAHDGLD